VPASGVSYDPGKSGNWRRGIDTGRLEFQTFRENPDTFSEDTG